MEVRLDKYQKEAVYIKESNVLVVAAPGSGKTTVIINRVNHLVMDLNIKIGNIIVITFTRSAADNMRSRYKKLFNRERTPFFGTFHGLFYKILLKEGYNITIIDGGIAHRIVKSVLTKYSDEVSEDKIKEVLNNISTFKTSIMGRGEFIPTITNDIFDECYEAYEGYKQKNHLWDFDDLSTQVIELLKNNKVTLKKYKDMFNYVLVDEFQDCDDIQVNFLKLINSGNELFAVGDEDQCIYSFRGSRPEYMVSFGDIFPKGKKVYLSINYRSKKNIVNNSKYVIENNENRNKKDINAFNETDGIIKYSKPYSENMQGEEIATIINESNDRLTENAILYRTNMEARSIIDVFTKRKIEFILLDKGYNFFEHFICKDILSYLRLAINISDKASFLHIINKPFRYISKSSLESVKSSFENVSPFDIIINKKDTPPFQAKKLDELKKEIQYLNKLSLGSAIQYIISDLKYSEYLKNYGEKYNQSIDDLEDILEEFKSAAEGLRTIIELFEHVENVKNQIEKSKGNKDGVILSTIHGVKGMEFKNVFLINCAEETLPHKSSIENNLEEERRLFYVGITRTINNLYLYSPRTIRGQFKDASRFIKEGDFSDESEVDHYGLKIGDYIHHRTHGNGKVENIEGDKVRINFNRDIVRSFSLRVLMENNLIIIIS